MDMKEVKTPKKPMLFYYAMTLLVILLFNSLAKPYFDELKIEQVDYGTFMNMTTEQQIGKVEIQDNQILFTNKDNTKTYKTGIMNDPELTARLHDSGVTFSQDIKEKESPFMSFIETWILPLLIFWMLTST